MNRKHRSIRTSSLHLAAAAGLSLVGASAAQAQWGGNGQQNAQLVFEWQGNVDRDTRIDVGQQGTRVYGENSNESRGRFVNRGTMPRGSGTLYVQRVSGRGSVDVIQQPGYNSGDGVIRITDPQGGQGYYDVRAYWVPNGGTYGSTYPNDGSYGNGYPSNGGYDRGRDGAYERNGEVAGNRNGVALDRNGNAVRDRHGKVVYERRGNEVVARDGNGNVVFDRNGKPVYQRIENREHGRGRRS